MNKGNESGKYVYCIIKIQEEQENFGNIGFQEKEVYTIKYKDFSPVISDVLFTKYDIDNEEDVKTHTRVVNEIMKKYSVIPVAYGMVFKNKKLVEISMRSGYKAMQKAMKIVDNKVELGVKLILPKDYEGNEQNAKECKYDFLKSLKQIAFDSKDLSLFSKRLIMNTSFLVEKDNVEAFSEEVERLESKHNSFKVQYSGPWSPYNFVDIHILSKHRGGFR